MMRMRRDFRMMRGIVPSFQYFPCYILPMMAIFCNQQLPLNNLKPLEHFEETAILKSDSITKHPKIALCLFP